MFVSTFSVIHFTLLQDANKTLSVIFIQAYVQIYATIFFKTEWFFYEK